MTSPNQAQQEYWGGDNARRWIAIEATNERLFSGFTNALLDAADLRTGTAVLDVGCGTGGTTIGAASRVGGAKVLGLDISDGMLERARVRTAEAGLANVTYVQGDAQVYAEAGRARFDRMISRFGVMFFADSVAAFRNIASMLRPGGTLTFLSWGDRAANPWFSIPARVAAAHFGAAPPAFDPAAPGPFAFADTNRVLAMMAEAGLERPSVTLVDIDFEPGTSPEEIRRYSLIGPIAMMMREHNGTEADLEAMEAALTAAYEDHRRPEGVRVPARCNLYSARVR